MDEQNDASSKVKTHEEIMKLFQEIQSVEAKVKNPEQIKQNALVTKGFLPEIEPPQQSPEEAIQETIPRGPTGEIPQKKEETHERSFLKKKETLERQPERKISWFRFLNKEQLDVSELEPTPETQQPEEEMKPPRSTFTLQLDPNGNLVGFPLKKPIKMQERKGWFSSKRKSQSETGDSEEETEKGIKGKIKHLFSSFRRRSSEDADSSEGIGEKIKGLFRRKNKE